MEGVARDIQKYDKLKQLADELEMVPQLESLHHNVNAPLTLLHRWRYEIKNGLEAHSLLVYHLKCIGLPGTSDRYTICVTRCPVQHVDNSRCGPDLVLHVDNLKYGPNLMIILCLFYLFHSLYYREFLSTSKTNSIAVSQ